MLKIYLLAFLFLFIFLTYWLHQDDTSLFMDMCIIRTSSKKYHSYTIARCLFMQLFLWYSNIVTQLSRF